MAKKRAFVRYSKNGKVVPGSLILTSGSFPSGPSTWKEVPADLCCEVSLPCLCYTITGVITGSAQFYDCENVLQVTGDLGPGDTVDVCATKIVPSDNYTFVAGDPCNVIYTCP